MAINLFILCSFGFLRFMFIHMTFIKIISQNCGQTARGSSILWIRDLIGIALFIVKDQRTGCAAI